MSGGKDRGKQSRDTASEEALVARPGATDPLLAAREVATEIAYALRQGLPQNPDPASIQGSRAGKQPEGTGTTEKGKQPAAQKKRTRTTRQAPQTQPLLLAADAFAAALGAVPAEDWCRTWAAGRTIVLRRTSKRVKEVVDKMRLPTVVRLSRSFWGDARNGTAAEKLQFVMRQLTLMTAWCRIRTLDLPDCGMQEQDAERLAGVLAQCPALAHLDLCGNSGFGAAGAERLAGVLGQCRELVHLNLSGNYIGAGGAERLAGVLGQCTALAHLNLSDNQIGAGGAESLAGVLGQCTALAHLNLWNNQIGPGGAESLARVLAQCPALAHLDLYGNWIGPAGAESLAGVLPQCAALAHLNLFANAIGTVGEGRLRASWYGQASGLLL
jgi:Ran GTPase-activating protein (RanGAP) involved in mRNA processing and transport